VRDRPPHFHFVGTGIGSVPFQDIHKTCSRILERLPDMPFWPQFVKRNGLEDMTIQYTEGLPLLEIHREKRTVTVSHTKDRESELVTFYDRFLSEDVEYFRITRDYAPGLYELLELLKSGEGGKGEYIKGQTVGPITFLCGIMDRNGKPILHSADLQEAMVRGLAIKALWQVKELGKSGRKVILFLDEPALSGFGSAFSAIQRHDVLEILRTVMDYLREHADPLIGIHCCGNTDWDMLMEAGPDIINFDAFDFMDYFLLYPEQIRDFLKNDGIVAWGIVPTSGFSGEENVEGLFSKLQKGLERLSRWGIEADVIFDRSILSPACGMGTMTPNDADKALDLLADLSERCSRPSLSTPDHGTPA
jgi:methionine synthase II (cobalamin-independent)